MHSPLYRVVVLIPDLESGRGDVFVSLWHKHAEVLRDIVYTIN